MFQWDAQLRLFVQWVYHGRGVDSIALEDSLVHFDGPFFVFLGHSEEFRQRSLWRDVSLQSLYRPGG